MFMTRISKGSHLQYHGIHMFFFPLPTSLILHLIGPTRVWREPELLRRRWLSNQPAAVLGCDRATTPGFNERLETPNMMVALVSTGDETAWTNMAMFWYLFVKFLGCTTVIDSYDQLCFQTLLCLSPRPCTWPIPGCQHILRLNDLPKLMADMFYLCSHSTPYHTSSPNSAYIYIHIIS